MMAKIATIKRRNKISDLKAEIARLHKVIGLSRGPAKFPGMTTSETIIFKAIAEADASKEGLALLIYGENWRGDDLITIKTFVARVRAKIEVHNIAIGSVWGWGYSMTESDRTKARELLESANV